MNKIPLKNCIDMKTNRAKFLPFMRKILDKQISQPMVSFLQQMTTADDGNDNENYEDYEMYHFATSL